MIIGYPVELRSHYGMIAVALSPDGRYLALATGGRDGIVYISDTTTKELVAQFETFRKHEYDWVVHLSFRADGKALVVGTADGQVRLWPLLLPKEPEPQWLSPVHTMVRTVRGWIEWIRVHPTKENA